MATQSPLSLRFLPAALVILSAAILTSGSPHHRFSWTVISSTIAQQSSDSKAAKHNVRPAESRPNEVIAGESKSPLAPARYTYEFTQPEFLVRHIVIEHNENGIGKITFEKKNEETPIVEPLELSVATLGRLAAHWEALRFLDSTTNYQSDKQFAHLGTMRIGMAQGERKRIAEFNWSNNNDAAALVAEYRRIADQAIFIFDVSVSRENQPLNAPKLMEQLESMLKRNWISDPKQLIPLLKDLSTDEHVPLIARNHALRLLKKIEK